MSKTGEYKVLCLACQDTGVNSNGNVCLPCKRANRQTVRNATVAAVQGCFIEHWRRGAVPCVETVVDAVREAMQPRVTYIAAFKYGAKITVFAGPADAPYQLLAAKPPKCSRGCNAYIIRRTRSLDPDRPPFDEPIAKWCGKWVRKKEHDQVCD